MNKGVSSTRMRFWIALGLSVLFHLTVGGGLVLTPTKKYSSRTSKTEVQLLTPEELKAMLAKQPAALPDSKAQQIVESDKTAINDEIDPKAKYLSQFNQRVLKETRAAQTGKFTNDAGQGRKQMASAASKPLDLATTETENSIDELKPTEDSVQAVRDLVEADILTSQDSDIAAAPRKGLEKFNPTFRKMPLVPDPTAEQTASGDGHEVSKTDDHLKVPTGMQTMLSTREFIYYSYYNRIKDKLRQYWEPKIREKFERTVRQGRQIASEGDKITKVVIVLDEKGTLIGVQILSASGLVDLDEAAVEAFRAAAPFPNPPKGIVGEDGTIKIRWDFVLEA